MHSRGRPRTEQHGVHELQEHGQGDPVVLERSPVIQPGGPGPLPAVRHGDIQGKIKVRACARP